MNKETKLMIVVSLIFFVVVYFIQSILLWMGYQTFDYCVTHICGVTHNYGIQDILWLIFNSLIIFYCVALGFWWIGYLRANPDGVV